MLGGWGKLLGLIKKLTQKPLAILEVYSDDGDLINAVEFRPHNEIFPNDDALFPDEDDYFAGDILSEDEIKVFLRNDPSPRVNWKKEGF